MIRAAYLALYAAFAALGAAMVARPALLWARSQGFLRASLAWDVPLGGLSFALLAALSLFTLALAASVALDQRRRVPVHALFLLIVMACIGARVSAQEPRPPKDPAPVLLEALRLAADEVDARYAGRYQPDAAVINGALAQAQDTGFRRNGRALRVHARVLSGSDGPQLTALPEDDPGTIYVAVSRDRSTAWITPLALDGVQKLPSGEPALIECHAGTHNAPGRDALVPLYPRLKQ